MKSMFFLNVYEHMKCSGMNSRCHRDISKIKLCIWHLVQSNERRKSELASVETTKERLMKANPEIFTILSANIVLNLH